MLPYYLTHSSLLEPHHLSHSRAIYLHHRQTTKILNRPVQAHLSLRQQCLKKIAFFGHISDYFCRHARSNFPSRYIFSDNGPCAHYRILSYCYTTDNNCMAGNFSIFLIRGALPPLNPKVTLRYICTFDSTIASLVIQTLGW